MGQDSKICLSKNDFVGVMFRGKHEKKLCRCGFFSFVGKQTTVEVYSNSTESENKYPPPEIECIICIDTQIHEVI